MFAGQDEAVLVHGTSVPRVSLSWQGSLDRCSVAHLSRELRLLAQVQSLRSLCCGHQFNWAEIQL